MTSKSVLDFSRSHDDGIVRQKLFERSIMKDAIRRRRASSRGSKTSEALEVVTGITSCFLRTATRIESRASPAHERAGPQGVGLPHRLIVTVEKAWPGSTARNSMPAAAP